MMRLSYCLSAPMWVLLLLTANVSKPLVYLFMATGKEQDPSGGASMEAQPDPHAVLAQQTGI